MANPLTLVMPLKGGVHLQQLGGLISMTKPQVEEALKAIGTVHYARFGRTSAATT